MFAVAFAVAALLPWPTVAAGKPELDPNTLRGGIRQVFERLPGDDATDRSMAIQAAIKRFAMQPLPAGWATAVRAIQAAGDPLRKLEIADQYVDAYTYKDRNENTWQSPTDFARRGGVCKDYAVAKMELLRQGSYPREDLRIVSIGPRFEDGEAHVVLAARVAGKHYILDIPGIDENGAAHTIDKAPSGDRTLIWAGDDEEHRGAFGRQAASVALASVRNGGPLDGREIARAIASTGASHAQVGGRRRAVAVPSPERQAAMAIAKRFVEQGIVIEPVGEKLAYSP